MSGARPGTGAVRPGVMVSPTPWTELAILVEDLAALLNAFIQSDRFPCVGAKAALARDQLRVVRARALDAPHDDVAIRDALKAFSAELDRDGPQLQSLVVVFDGPDALDEAAFETALWNRLQALHNLDAVAGEAWASDVSTDPASAHFSMSVAGEPFFVVGLHANASRPSRRFARPALAFNAHRQFEALREDGRYDVMKTAIRERERSEHGGINPMLADFGEGREAAQYSGRQVDEDWTAPFTPQPLKQPVKKDAS